MAGQSWPHPRGVDDVRVVDFREEVFDQLLSELFLHVRIGGNHPDVAAASIALILLDRQFPKSLRERHSERVLSVASAIQPSVRFVLCLVFHCDVRRVAHDDVVALAEDLPQCCRVFNSVDWLHLEQAALSIQRDSFTLPSRFAAEQEAIASC